MVKIEVTVLTSIALIMFVFYLLYIFMHCGKKKKGKICNDVEQNAGTCSVSALMPNGTVTTILCESSSSPRNHSNDLPPAALVARREKQLRKIKQEINELSRRLGFGRMYEDYDEPAPGRMIITDNYAYSQGGPNSDDSLDDSSLDISLSNPQLPLPYSCDTSRTGGLGLVQTFTLAGGSSVVVEEDHHDNTQIAIERRRRLGLIRSEIFDLTLQLDELHPEQRLPTVNNARGRRRNSVGVGGRLAREGYNFHPRINVVTSLSGLPPTYDEILLPKESPPPSYSSLGYLSTRMERNLLLPS